MTARDFFSAKLHCLYCGKEAEVHLSQADGWSYLNNSRTKIEKLPESFKGIDNSEGADNLAFTCVECDSPAVCL
jgi:hypothetical protein